MAHAGDVLTLCAPPVLPICALCAQQGLERTLAAAVQQALSASVQLHRFPKSVVDVYIFVLEAGGGEVATAINAASVALADAGIELYDLVAACHMVSRCQQNALGLIAVELSSATT